MKEVAGKLTISRLLDGRDGVRIRVVSDNNLVITDTIVSVSLFGEATLGHSNVECAIKLHDNYDRVDAAKELDKKRIDVKYANRSGPTKAEIDRALAKHEVNGWKADRSDFDNHHRSLGWDSDAQIKSTAVNFHRYVRPDGTPILD